MHDRIKYQYVPHNIVKTTVVGVLARSARFLVYVSLSKRSFKGGEGQWMEGAKPSPVDEQGGAPPPKGRQVGQHAPPTVKGEG